MIFLTSCKHTAELSSFKHSTQILDWCELHSIEILYISSKLNIDGKFYHRWILPDEKDFSMFALRWPVAEIVTMNQ